MTRQSKEPLAVPGNGGRRARKKAAVRQRLYDAALRLFRKRGYEPTTVQDIANLADTSKATFFTYFATKEHVLVAYHQEMGKEILASLAGQTFSSSEGAVQAALRACAAWVVGDPAMGRLIIRLMFGSDLLLASDADNVAQLGDWLAQQLTSGQSRAELHATLDIPLFISLLMAALSSSVIEWVAGERAFDLEGRVEEKVHFLFQAARVGT